MSAIDDWKRAGEAADPAAAVHALANDAELISPLTAGFLFRGANEIGQLLGAVLEITSDYRYEADVRGDSDAFLTARATVRGVELHEFQYIELDDDARIRRVTVAMRPLPAITAFARALGPILARAQGNATRARTLTLAGALLDSVAKTGDRKFIPLAAPVSAR